ncbi:MAG TPA: PIN domain-containing protein [Candidatus Dormibacteraeota bacterium]|nr:PIN domain-containing protein [Candidatus Dormibacteraeota bacterium]
MALSHLADTSVITRLTRREVRAVVEPLLRSGRVGRSAMSDLEVGFSARNVAEWDRLLGALQVFDLVEVTAAHMRRARQVQRLLCARHQRGRKVPDLLIAAAAEEAAVTLLHYDADFDLISEVTGQPCQWVVPAGAID